MVFAHWMILAAASLPYLTILGVKLAGGHRFDNRRPRAWLEARSGWQQRGDWAHRNHFEAFAIFAAAVLVAEASHGRQDRIDLFAGLFILTRVAYTAFYLADRATLRSIAWALGFVLTIWLFVLGA